MKNLPLSGMQLKDLNEIRIIINGGAGLGHQKANITLMQRLRELGFQGVFDVRYVEVYPVQNDKYGEREKSGIIGRAINAFLPEDPQITEQRAYAGHIGRVLHMLIPTFIPHDFNEDDPGQVIDASYLEIGQIRITRLPREFYYGRGNRLPPTQLTMTAADDHAMSFLSANSPFYSIFRFSLRTPDVFSSDVYVCLQPTNWGGERFVKDSNDAACYNISKDAKLFSHVDLVVDPKKLSSVEIKILELIHHEAYQTQLFYTSKSSLKKTFPPILYSILEQAHRGNRQDKDKPLLILMPRTEVKADIDLTQSSIDAIPSGRPIIKVYIGDVSQEMFEYLLRETTYPPMLEGANSIAYCEERGVPYIHCLDNDEPLSEYEVENEDMQALHQNASECMQKQDMSKIPALKTYLKKVGEKDEQILEYHEERAEKFHERPDACEVALNKLHIKYDDNASQKKRNKM